MFLMLQYSKMYFLITNYFAKKRKEYLETTKY